MGASTCTFCGATDETLGQHIIETTCELVIPRNYKRDLKVQKAARAKEAIFITEGSSPQPGLNGQANAGDGDGGAHAKYDQDGDVFDLDEGSASTTYRFPMRL